MGLFDKFSVMEMTYDSYAKWKAKQKTTDFLNQLETMEQAEKWNFLCDMKLSEIIELADFTGTEWYIRPDDRNVKYHSIAHAACITISMILYRIAGRFPLNGRLLTVKEKKTGFDRRTSFALLSEKVIDETAVKNELLCYIVMQTEETEIVPDDKNKRKKYGTFSGTGMKITDVKILDSNLNEWNPTIGELLDKTEKRKDYIARRMYYDIREQVETMLKQYLKDTDEIILQIRKMQTLLDDTAEEIQKII